MPKKSGKDHKALQLGPSRPATKARSIDHQEKQPDGPHRNPLQHPPIRGSNAIAAEVVRVASDRGGKIDPRQQLY